MKNTKRYLFVVLAIAIAVASVFALSSCGGGGHEHEYTTAVTEPTCTERGYTTYTCSCGESYVDNYVDAKHDLVEHAAKHPNCKEAGYEAYVTCKNCDYTTYKEIASTGEHYYDQSIVKIPTAEKSGKAIYTCEGCGDSYESEITLEDIELPDVMGFIASLIGDGHYAIDLGDGFNLICLKEVTKNDEYDLGYHVFEGEKAFYAIKLPNASLDVKDGVIKGGFTLEVGIARVSFEESEDPDEITLVEFDSESVHSLTVDGNNIAFSVTDGDYSDEFEGTVYELLVSLASTIMRQEIEYETALEIYAVVQQLQCFLPVFDTIGEKLSAPVDPEAEPDMTVVIELLTALGSKIVEITEEGEDTVYTLKLENLSEYVTYLKTATVADIIDDCFGEGLTETITEFIIGLPNRTVKEIADTAIEVSEAYGLNVDEFFALVNGAVYLYSDAEFDIAAEIDKRNEYTLAMLIAEFKNAPEADLADIAQEFTDTLTEIVELVTTSTVDELFELLSAKEAPDSEYEGGEEYVDEELEDEEEEEEPELFTDMLAGIVAMLGDKINVQVVVDGEGNVKNADFSIAGNATGSYTVNSDGSVSASLTLYDYSINYISNDGAYTVIVKEADTEILNGEFTITEEGYAFTGALSIMGIEADLTASYTLDGELSVLVSYEGDATYELSLEYDGENFDVLFNADEKEMFKLCVDILEGTVTNLTLDVHLMLEETVESGDGYEYDETTETVYSHVISITYTANDDGTHKVEFKVPVDEVIVEITFDPATGTFNLSGEQYGRDLFVAEVVITKEKLSMDATIYIENEDAQGNKTEEISKVDILWTAEEFKYIIRYNNEYDILNMQATFEDGKITSATMTVEDYDYDGDRKVYYDAMSLVYTTEGNTGNLVIELYEEFKAVAVITTVDGGFEIDLTVTKYVFEEEESDEFELIVVFDGKFGAVKENEDGTHTLTLSADVEKILLEIESYEVENVEILGDVMKLPLEIIEKLLLVFDGEITFIYTEAE